jgi:hypothetical protein
MSEPGAGSDVVGMRCRADARGGAFVLNGTKMWCTNGTVADTLVVYAKTQADGGAHGITAFLIEKGMQVARPGCAAPAPHTGAGAWPVPTHQGGRVFCPHESFRLTVPVCRSCTSSVPLAPRGRHAGSQRAASRAA